MKLKIVLDATVRMPNGDAVLFQENDLTYRVLLYKALTSTLAEDQQQSLETRVKRMELATKVHKSAYLVANLAEVILLHQLILRVFPNPIVVYAFLEAFTFESEPFRASLPLSEEVVEEVSQEGQRLIEQEGASTSNAQPNENENAVGNSNLNPD